LIVDNSDEHVPITGSDSGLDGSLLDNELRPNDAGNAATVDFLVLSEGLRVTLFIYKVVIACAFADKNVFSEDKFIDALYNAVGRGTFSGAVLAIGSLLVVGDWVSPETGSCHIAFNRAGASSGEDASGD
jgi:hypothetical protein